MCRLLLPILCVAARLCNTACGPPWYACRVVCIINDFELMLFLQLDTITGAPVTESANVQLPEFDHAAPLDAALRLGRSLTSAPPLLPGSADTLQVSGRAARAVQHAAPTHQARKGGSKLRQPREPAVARCCNGRAT